MPTVVSAGVGPTRGLLSGHVWDRLAARLQPHERGEAVLRTVTYLRARPTGRHAVRILKLDMRRGTWDRSNGDEVWAVLEEGKVKTVMLRRSTQPRSRWALQVDQVHFAV